MSVKSGKPASSTTSSTVRTKSPGPRIYQDGIHLIKEDVYQDGIHLIRED